MPSTFSRSFQVASVMMAARQHMQSQYESIDQTSRGERTAAIVSENNHLSVAEVSVDSLSNVEGGIALVDNRGRGRADCSSEGRQEGDKANRDHVGQERPEMPRKRGVSG